MGIAIANRKSRCDFGALRTAAHQPLRADMSLPHSVALQVVESGNQEEEKALRGGRCGRVKMEPFVLLASFPCFTVIFAQEVNPCE